MGDVLVFQVCGHHVIWDHASLDTAVGAIPCFGCGHWREIVSKGATHQVICHTCKKILITNQDRAKATKAYDDHCRLHSSHTVVWMYELEKKLANFRRLKRRYSVEVHETFL